MKFYHLIFFAFLCSSAYSQIEITVTNKSQNITVKKYCLAVISRTTSEKKNFCKSIPSNYFQSFQDSVYDIELSIASQKYLFKGIAISYLQKAKSLDFQILTTTSDNCCQIYFADIAIGIIGSRQQKECNTYNALTIVGAQIH